MKKAIFYSLPLVILTLVVFAVPWNVGAQTNETSPSITVLSPNNEETYKVGDVINIKWSSKNTPPSSYIGIYLSTKEEKYAVSVGGFISATTTEYRYMVSDANILNGFIKTNTPYKVLVYSFKQGGPIYAEGTSEKDIKFIPPTPVEFNVTTLPSRDDRAGVYGQFFSGGAPNWNWQVVLKYPATSTIDNILIIREWVPEYWSTNGLYMGNKTWPIVVYKDGKQMNDKYQDYINVPVYPGINTFTLYGLSNSQTFNNAIISVKLHNGINLTARLPEYKASTSTPTGTLSVTPLPANIVSGGTTTLNFTTHSNATSSELYLSCPVGVSAKWLGSIGGNMEICNIRKKFNPSTVPGMTLQINNSTTKVQDLVPNFYEYLVSDPNYAVGVSSKITVKPGAITPPSLCYQFNTNLTIGSTGPDVVALQTILIAKGYGIPDISSGLAPKGYFGQSTANAVKAYQTATGIDATGFVGPITRVALNSSCTNNNIVPVSNTSATAVANSNGTNVPTSATITFGFTIYNSSSTDLYISTNPSVALATTSTIINLSDTVLRVGNISVSPSLLPGDSNVNTNYGYYIIPSNTSRVFNYVGTLDNKNGISGLQSASVVGINFSFNKNNLRQYRIVSGLENLKTPALKLWGKSDTTRPVITVSSPTKGEYKTGDWVKINWKTTNLSSSQKLDINLSLDSRGIGKEIVKGIPNSGSYMWKVKGIEPFYDAESRQMIYPNGTYRISVVCPIQYSVCNISNNFGESNIFTIVSKETEVSPDVNTNLLNNTRTIVSPTPTYSSTPAYSPSTSATPSPTYTAVPVITTTPSPTPVVTSTPVPTYTTTPSPSNSSTPTPTYSPSPSSTPSPTSSPVSNVFGKYQTASVWDILKGFFGFAFISN